MLGEDLHEGRPTTSMKKGWLYRNSYDEIVYTWWWLEEIQIERWSRSSYDDSERSRSSDDLDPAVVIQIEWWSRSGPVMLIQIEWWSRSSDAIWCWSRSSDDPDPVQWCWSRSSDDLDLVMPFVLIHIERWSRSRWLEDEYDSKTKMIQLMQRRRPVLKNCVERIPS